MDLLNKMVQSAYISHPFGRQNETKTEELEQCTGSNKNQGIVWSSVPKGQTEHTGMMTVNFYMT